MDLAMLLRILRGLDQGSRSYAMGGSLPPITQRPQPYIPDPGDQGIFQKPPGLGGLGEPVTNFDTMGDHEFYRWWQRAPGRADDFRRKVERFRLRGCYGHKTVCWVAS